MHCDSRHKICSLIRGTALLSFIVPARVIKNIAILTLIILKMLSTVHVYWVQCICTCFITNKRKLYISLKIMYSVYVVIITVVTKKWTNNWKENVIEQKNERNKKNHLWINKNLQNSSQLKVYLRFVSWKKTRKYKSMETNILVTFYMLNKRNIGKSLLIKISKNKSVYTIWYWIVRFWKKTPYQLNNYSFGNGSRN